MFETLWYVNRTFKDRNREGVDASTIVIGSARCICLLQCMYPSSFPYLEIYIGYTTSSYVHETCEGSNHTQEVGVSGEVNVEK